FKKSIELFEDILKQLDVLHDNEEFEVKVRYNHAKALYLDNQYEESLYQVNKAIEISCRINSMALIGQLYYQRGECLGKLEYDEAEVEDAYKKASFFFDILEMHAYKEALVNKISR
ncbi:transcriptional regulator, partial [Bacillus thuringiensis]